MPSTADQRLAAVAANQEGVFTLAQAGRCGVARSTVHARWRGGVYRRLQRNVYAFAAVPDSRGARWRAALLAAGDGAVLSHATAAYLFGLDGWRLPSRIDVLTVGRPVKGLVGVRAHRTLWLPPEHTTHLAGKAATTPGRTIADLSTLPSSAGDLRAALGDGIRRLRVDPRGILDILDGLGNRHGNNRLRRLVAELAPGEERARGEMEALYQRVTTNRGLPPASLNHPVRDVYGRRRYIDAAYPAERLPVELDGRRFHSLFLDVNDDVRRENGIVLVGWRSFLRFTWWDLRDDPDRVAYEVGLALEAARRDLARNGVAPASGWLD